MLSSTQLDSRLLSSNVSIEERERNRRGEKVQNIVDFHFLNSKYCFIWISAESGFSIPFNHWGPWGLKISLQSFILTFLTVLKPVFESRILLLHGVLKKFQIKCFWHRERSWGKKLKTKWSLFHSSVNIIMSWYSVIVKVIIFEADQRWRKHINFCSWSVADMWCLLLSD